MPGLGVLSGLGTLGLLILLGWEPARLLKQSGRGPLLSVACALACGAALWGLTGFALNVVGVPVAAWQLLALALGAEVLVRTWRGMRRSSEARSEGGDAVRAVGAGDTRPLPPRRGPLVSGALAVVLLVSAGSGLGQPFRGDGSKFWLPKARDTLVTSVAETPALQDPRHLGFHRNYPLLGPVLLAPALEHAPQEAHVAGKLVLVGLHAALLLILLRLLLREGDPGWVMSLCVLSMPVLVTTAPADSPVAGGLMDGVAALFLLLFVHAVDALRRGVGLAPAAALWGGALACTKLEGAVAVAIVVVAALLAGPRRGALAALLLWISPVVALLAVFLTSVPSSPPISNLPLLLDPTNLATRAPALLAGFAAVLLDVTRFGVLPLVILGAALSPAGRRAGFAWWIAAGVMGFLVVVYLSTTMHLGRHLETSAHRLALQWLPAFAWLAARALATHATDTERSKEVSHGR